MSLQKLGKNDSPPVIANGVHVMEQVPKVNFVKSPPQDFDINKLAERARVVAASRSVTPGV